VMPRPSMRASSTPPNTAERAAERRPERICKKPPVSVPAMIALNGSSFVFFVCGYAVFSGARVLSSNAPRGVGGGEACVGVR
jgi:hypothetical protein